MSTLRDGPFPQHQLKVGDRVERQTLESVHSGRVRIPDDARIVHLQFRRYAGCPICNLHLQQIVSRHEEIRSAGILEVAVFHSTQEEMREFSGLPFAVIADPKRRLYQRFGVERSPRAILDPRSWPAMALGAWEGLRQPSQRPSITTVAGGGSFGLPADFLIAPDGRVLACGYGVHADDQWSVDQLLTLVRGSHP